MAGWTTVLELDKSRHTICGSEADLNNAIRRGADLHVITAFRHNEHVDVQSDNPETVEETMAFGITYLLDNRWTAGIANLRMPVDIPDGFGPRASMSFFLYNQDGCQAIARPYLDGQRATGTIGPSNGPPHKDMPNFNLLDDWDAGTNAPSTNFIYQFDFYRFVAWDGWKEVLSHNEDGSVESGSIDQLYESFIQGKKVKVGIRGLCADLDDQTDLAMAHEVFVQVDHCYYYTERKLLIAAAHPLVRVKPAIPLVYQSRIWDFGWLLPRTDGLVARWLCDPYTLKFRKSTARHPIRWFVR